MSDINAGKRVEITCIRVNDQGESDLNAYKFTHKQSIYKDPLKQKHPKTIRYCEEMQMSLSKRKRNFLFNTMLVGHGYTVMGERWSERMRTTENAKYPIYIDLT